MGLNHYMADLYPNMGFNSTSFITVAEAEDQVSLVDDQKTAVDMKVTHDPIVSRNIWVSVGIVFAIAVAMAYFSKGV